ncbi:hypothetical protein HDE78_003938 [Rhodanobacter sp. K2T2]|uniref:hypothetical protein n=1 Tax=Rhodanobacter sp. K2T2 TaxID=2723085 RepID=UPI0015CD0A39|nr:hypothetical protein [Rhodanobacter sp. K2T2]NYE30961.1 hypothetical protein [Rhodanobacter sp. K2T2]
MARTRTNDQSPSLEQLRQWLPKGTRVFTILRSVSRSGMRREISVVVFLPGDDRPIHPNHHVCKVLGLRRGKSDGVVLNGCGMDMGFHLVYELAHALYGDTDALTQEWL